MGGRAQVGLLGVLWLWAEADVGSGGGVPLWWGFVVLGVVGVPVGVGCAPAVRRLTVPGRAVATGLATCAFTFGVLLVCAFHAPL